MPTYFAVFGLDTTFGQPSALIPFVHTPAIALERMSSDPAEGWHSNELATALVVPPPPVLPPVLGGFPDVATAERAAPGAGGLRPNVRTLRRSRSAGDPGPDKAG